MTEHGQPMPRGSADLAAAVDAIDYQLRPLDIVLLYTGADERLGSAAFFDQPGARPGRGCCGCATAG